MLYHYHETSNSTYCIKVVYTVIVHVYTISSDKSYSQSQKFEPEHELSGCQTPCARLALKIRGKRGLRVLPKPYSTKKMNEVKSHCWNPNVHVNVAKRKRPSAFYRQLILFLLSKTDN
ncbi:hypothetical protein D8674_013367 [Pyrus ussuriensis x Pyrus communis]|uniref:Uncharacterized protein n=1 Tax=Pyrus ussuriensis x Pyrus communis TaxID=2448454 RepID=A0A5N5GQF2_9ROSA|nr:hypothetical protein D8674_013367 [Pyrus ussuriensis x Pyrus communis]